MAPRVQAVVLLSAVLAAAGPARALDVGDPAPPLDVQKWLVGHPLTAEEAKGRLRIVFFWASWDGATEKCLGLLNRVHTLHADSASVVAITGEDEAGVAKFLAEHPVAFRVALDDAAKSKKAWLRGITGLPHAFLVGRDGRVAWHGEPEIALAAALADLLAGKLDAAPYRKLADLHRDLLLAVKASKVAEALALLDQMIATVPGAAWAHHTRAAILVKQGKLAEARDAYLAMGKSCHADPEALDEAATRLATAHHLPLRDSAAALDFAQRAVQLTDQRDPDALATLARVHYELAHLAKAIELQALAAKAAPERERPARQATLAFYRREQLRRASDPDAK